MEDFSSHLPSAQKSDVYLRLRSLIASKDPKVVAAVLKANKALRACKDVAGTVHVNSALTNMSVQYKNEDFIGTELMPIVTVSKSGGVFFKYNKRDRLATPDDSVGQRSMPNEVTEGRTTTAYACKDYALRDFVSEKTLRNQDAPLDEMVDLIASVNDAIAYREEKRIATVLTTAGNYASTVTLSGTSQWSDYTNSNPISDIETARDAIWAGMGPSRLVGFCSNAVWNMLRHHPKLIAEFKYSGVNSGFKALARQQVAEYFELDDLLVAKAWEDTANEGQTVSTGRIWGKHFGIVRVATSPGIRTASFGYTFRHGDKMTTQWYDPAPGVGGGYWGKVGLTEDHNVVASDAGYLIVNAVA